MRLRLSVLAGSILTVLLAADSRAFAQSGSQPPQTHASMASSDSRMYVAFGYMGQFFGKGDNYAFGVGVRGGYKLGTAEEACIRAVGELGLYFGSEDHVQTFLGGAEVGLHAMPNFVPYVEALAGAAHFGGMNFGQTNFMTRFGGGVDIKLKKLPKFDLRVGAGLATDFFSGSATSGHNSGIELTADLKYKF